MKWLILALSILALSSCAVPPARTVYHNLSPSEIGGSAHVFLPKSIYPNAKLEWQRNVIYAELAKHGFSREDNGPEAKWVILFVRGVNQGSTSYDIYETSTGYNTSTTTHFVHELALEMYENRAVRPTSRPPRWKCSVVHVTGFANMDGAFPTMVNAAFANFPGVSGE